MEDLEIIPGSLEVESTGVKTFTITAGVMVKGDYSTSKFVRFTNTEIGEQETVGEAAFRHYRAEKTIPI